MIIPGFNIYKKNKVGFCVGVCMLVICFGSGSCRKTVDTERLTSYNGTSYSDVFESFWHGMNTNYVFWDIETVNWDNMYKTYKPRFEYLDKNKSNANNGSLAVQYLVDMTKDLMDSHLDLSFTGNATFLIDNYPLTGSGFNPAAIRHQLRGDRAPIPRNVFDFLIPAKYLTKTEYGTDGQQFEMNMGIIPYNNKNILYLEFTSFELQSNYYGTNSTSAPVKPVLDDFFRYTKDPSIDGLIIDLRGNPGGSVGDLDFFLGRLITDSVHVTYNRIKNGNGRLDYTPWVKGYIHPQPGGVDFTDKPVALLVDMYSVSMSEMTSISAKAIFPKAKLVGEQTWGGTGQIPQTDVSYLAGQFTAANFVQVYMAGAELRDRNMICYENKGLTPDIPIAYDTTAIKNNFDIQLNKGLDYVSGR